jgi:hypothetical protein
VRFFSATFLRLLETYGFPYRNRKNVIYSRNVMRNFFATRPTLIEPSSQKARKKRTAQIRYGGIRAAAS